MQMHQSSRLAELPGLTHGFLGRRGGVSEGIYASLNCGPGSKDNPKHIIENRRRVAEALSAKTLITLHQVHSNKVIGVCSKDGSDIHTPELTLISQNEMSGRIEADALVTNRPGIALGILTADCGPVLFSDTGAGVIGAAHAGWKGALGGVLENTVAAMERLGAQRERVVATLGPSIAQASYEVDAVFYERFCDADSYNRRFFIASQAQRHAVFPTSTGAPIHHYRFDLPGYILYRLEQCSIQNAESLGKDTYVQEDDFFSYRRATHRAEEDYGRQISVIMLS